MHIFNKKTTKLLYLFIWDFWLEVYRDMYSDQQAERRSQFPSTIQRGCDVMRLFGGVLVSGREFCAAELMYCLLH